MNSLMPITHDLPAQMGGGGLRPYEADRVDLRELLGAMLRRAWLALGVALVLFALGVAVVMNISPKYTATGAVLIDPHHQNLAQEPVQTGLPPDTSAVDTQVEVLRSRALAEVVVRKMDLYNDPEFNADLKKRPGAIANPSPAVVEKVTEQVMAHTKVKREGLTYVIQVAFTSKSATRAAAIVNTFMSSYMQRQLDAKSQAIIKANNDLGPNIERLRSDAEAAQAKVQQYKAAHNLMTVDAGQTMAAQEISTLNEQIAKAKAATAAHQARLETALAQVKNGGGGQDVGAALGSQTINDLRKREADLSTRLAQLKTDFKDGYPDVQRTENELTAERSQIQQENNRVNYNQKAEAAAAT